MLILYKRNIVLQEWMQPREMKNHNWQEGLGGGLGWGGGGGGCLGGGGGGGASKDKDIIY